VIKVIRVREMRHYQSSRKKCNKAKIRVKVKGTGSEVHKLRRIRIRGMPTSQASKLIQTRKKRKFQSNKIRIWPDKTEIKSSPRRRRLNNKSSRRCKKTSIYQI